MSCPSPSREPSITWNCTGSGGIRQIAISGCSTTPMSSTGACAARASGRVRFRAGPRVVEAHPGELECRGHDVVPERPHARRRPQRDLRRGVAADQVIDRDPLQRIDDGAAHPVPRGLRILGERLRRKAVEVEPRLGDPVEPAVLDDVNPRLRPAVKEPRDMFRGGPRPSPERAAWALTREPVEGHVPRIDRPDEKLITGRSLCPMRREPRDGRVFAHVPESRRTLARIWWRRSPHQRNSRKTKDLGAFASGSLNPGPDLFSRGPTSRVSSALVGLTTVFGMGTGMTPPLQGPRLQFYRAGAGRQRDGVAVVPFST